MSFIKITLKEFLQFLEDGNLNYEEVLPSADTKEYVFDVPAGKNTILRIFSSIDIRSKISRNYGADAIRLLLINKEFDIPVTKSQKTLRMENWRDHLSRKINYLLDYIEYFDRTCPLCNSPMFVRKGMAGEFWGCSKYPECNYTNDYNEPTNNPKQTIHQEWIFELKLTEIDGLPRCPACRRVGHIDITENVTISCRTIYWRVKCNICGTRGKIINDLDKPEEL